MPYNFVSDSFHIKKLCSRLSSCEVRFYTKSAVLHSWDHLGDLRATYEDHLRLIRKCVVDFLLVLIELISLGVTAEELQVNISWKSAISLQRGSVDQKFHLEGVAPHQPFFLSENYAKRSFVWYNNLDRSFLHFVTNHAFDRQTDRRTDRQNSHC